MEQNTNTNQIDFEALANPSTWEKFKDPRPKGSRNNIILKTFLFMLTLASLAAYMLFPTQ